jgi:hypothetical protein
MTTPYQLFPPSGQLEAAQAILGLREWLDIERLRDIETAVREELSESYVLAEQIAQCDLIREVVGYPVSLDHSWLTFTVIALANGIYDQKAFDRMPILADALQDAGCDNEEILNHCRQPSEHVRGCWVVDLLLDKQ